MDNWNQTEKRPNKKDKMSITDQFLVAMFSPKEYGILCKQPIKRLIAFLACLLLLVTIIQSAVPTLGAIAGMGGLKNIFLNKLPNFELKDGQFTYDDRIEIKDEQAGIYVLVDTEQQSFSESDVEKNEHIIETILVSKSNMIVSNYASVMGNLVQNYPFKDLGNSYLSNQTLVDYIPLAYGVLVLGFCFAYLANLINYLVSALIFSLFIYLMSRFMITKKLQFGEVYKVSLYAKTIGAIVIAVTICAGGTLLIMAGDMFAVFITVVIMNRVCLRKYMAV